ncbi:fibronectin type III domain-containing protein 8 [Ornithorhynchus anatinus]|uniref:fibronectin type III domain-containing protein 8 n=1 Tax=Ornithorhynchus anatinus TaxID=9258 RepID=UPI0019D4E35E|nr:fibronectin type III domain-containing protein 8 [Ornithorhynchus anatinus]
MSLQRSPGARPRTTPRSSRQPSGGREDSPEDRRSRGGRASRDPFRETIWEEDDPVILYPTGAGSTGSSDESGATSSLSGGRPAGARSPDLRVSAAFRQHLHELKLASPGGRLDLGGLPSSCPHSRRARRPPPAPLDLDDADLDTETTSTPSESTVALEVPDAPFVHKHTVDDVTATITWEGPEAKQRVSFYQVMLRVLETPDGVGSVDAPDPWVFNQIAGSTIKLVDLRPGTRYCLSVRAANTAGAGEWCPPYKFATLAGGERGFEKSPVRVTVRRGKETQRRTVHLGGGEGKGPERQPPEPEEGRPFLPGRPPRPAPRWCPRAGRGEDAPPGTAH